MTMKKILSLLFWLCIISNVGAQTTTTPNLGLEKPPALPGTWAVDINENFDRLDAMFPGGVSAQTVVLNGSQHRCADAGATDDYVCSRSITTNALVTGMWIDLIPNTTNTLAATLNLESLGVRSILQHDGSALTTGLLVSGLSYRLTLHADGTWRMQAGGTGGGAGSGTVSGTATKIGKFSSATVIGDSIITQEDNATICVGDCSGNHHKDILAAPTGTHEHTVPAATGTYAQTTTGGSYTTNNCAKFDANRILVDAGAPCGGTGVGAIITAIDNGNNLTCSAPGDTVYLASPFSTHGSAASAALDSPLAGTLKNLFIFIPNNVPAGQTVVTTLLKNGSTSGVTCSITAGNSKCSDTINTSAVAVGDDLSIQVVCSGGTTALSHYRVAYAIN